MRHIAAIALAVALAVAIACSPQPILEQNLVPPARLAGTLQPVAGWMMRMVEGRTVSGERRPGSNPAERVPHMTRGQAVYYSRGSVVLVEVTDSVTDSGILAGLVASLTSGDKGKSGGGQSQSMTIGSTPGVESWNASTTEGQITLLVAKRFVVSITGRGMNDVSVLRDFASKLDTTKLAALRTWRGV